MNEVGREVVIKSNSINDHMGYAGFKGVITRKLPVASDKCDYEVMFTNGTYDYFRHDELEFIQ